MRVLSVKFGAVVAPDERHVHDVPTATLGGVAMFGAFLLAMFVAWRLDAFHLVFTSSSEPLGVVLGATIIFTVGLLDDLYESYAPAKASGIVLAGGVVSLLGVTMFFFRIPLLRAGRAVTRPRSARHCAVGRGDAPTRSTSSTASTGWLRAPSRSAGAFFLYAQRF